MNVIFHNKRGRSSFPLTNSTFFQDGYCTTNQLSIIIYRKIIDGTMICIEYQQSTCLFSMVFMVSVSLTNISSPLDVPSNQLGKGVSIPSTAA